jgi:hypothetical protein
VAYVTVNCEVCKKPFQAKKADRARGWAKCCSKSCAASKREKKTGNYAQFKEMQAAAIRAGREHEGFDADLDVHPFSEDAFTW